MQTQELLTKLKETMGFKPTLKVLAQILGHPSEQTLYGRSKRNSTFPDNEIEKIEDHYGISLRNSDNNSLEIEYINIHNKLFAGIYDHAGKIRNYNITKKEWVLDGKSVVYGNAYDLNELLEYDFKQEKEFNYSNLSNKEFIKHIAKFIANLWQIHIFGEGNTRTTAVFLIKYLNTKGFNLTNDLFAKNSWYFRMHWLERIIRIIY